MNAAGPPLVVAHRGASRAFAENTVAAFRGAAGLGADWVELDVRRTADGELVVHHDPTLGPDGPALVDLERRALPADVCSLAEALAVCEQASPRLGVNIEIKSGRDEPDYDPAYPVAAAVLEVVAASWHADPAGSLLVTSFDVRAIDRVRALDAGMPTGLLSAQLDDVAKVVGLARDRGHQALNPWDLFVTPELVASAQDAGLAVNVWTVDDPARMVELAAMGVDGIITNVPDVARDALG